MRGGLGGACGRRRTGRLLRGRGWLRCPACDEGHDVVPGDASGCTGAADLGDVHVVLADEPANGGRHARGAVSCVALAHILRLWLGLRRSLSLRLGGSSLGAGRLGRGLRWR